MCLANIAWLLASSGHKTLVVDWDLEAPGLHRFFHPFLPDPELASTDGLIEFLQEYVAEALRPRSAKTHSADWYARTSKLTRYAFSLRRTEFSGGGTLDFVPAGRQDAGYASKVTSFDWERFFTRFGGGLFLQAVREHLRSIYDFVLIDSRTGVSDISGVCTVQMPDELVVAFTYNHQNIKGAAAVVASVVEQRSKGPLIWPVPMRVELAEKSKLETARFAVREAFDRYLTRQTAVDRTAYWGSVEIPHDPYYAFEEVLATFAEKAGVSNSVLGAMERITSWLVQENSTTDQPSKFKWRAPEEEDRLKALDKYARRLAPLTCKLETYPTVVRGEGLCEALPEVVLRFTGGLPVSLGGTPHVMSVTAFVNTTLTSRFIPPDGISVGLVPQAGGKPISGSIKPPGSIRSAGNAVSFPEMVIDPPGVGQETVWWIRGLRANVAERGARSQVVLGDPHISLFVATSGADPVAVQNPQIRLASVRNGFQFQILPEKNGTLPVPISQEKGHNVELFGEREPAALGLSFRVRFEEGFAGAFKTKNQEGSSATTGTRFLVDFSNVPSGVEIFVTESCIDSHASQEGPVLAPVVVYVGSNVAGQRQRRVPPYGPLVQLRSSGGTCNAEWEWNCAAEGTQSGLRACTFGVVLAARPNKAALGIGSISGTLGPVSDLILASEYGPIPRFINVGEPQDVIDVRNADERPASA